MVTKVEGLERLKKRFARLPAKMKAEVKVAIETGADELVAMQKRLVPVDQGDLQDSIRKEPGRHEMSVSVKAGSNRAFYARFQEFGTVDHPPQPFFFPPYRALRRRIRSRIGRAVSKAVKANV
jgi:HK97 gp10 family phage protein